MECRFFTPSPRPFPSELWKGSFLSEAVICMTYMRLLKKSQGSNDNDCSIHEIAKIIGIS